MSCPFSSHEQQSRKKIEMEIYTNDDNMFGSHFSLSKTLIFDFPPFLHIPDFLLDIGYRGGWGGGGQGALNTQHSTKLYMGRLHCKVQTLTLLYTIFDRIGTPFVHLPQKIEPLSYTYRATLLHFSLACRNQPLPYPFLYSPL